MNSIKKTFQLFFVISIFAVSSFAHAHEDNTVVGSQTVGKYRIEFEYSAQTPVYAGQPYQFVAYFLDNKTGETLAVDSMFMRIADTNGTLVLAGKLGTSMGISGTGRLLGMIPLEGNYNATLEFLDGDTKIASATFPFSALQNPVLPESQSNRGNYTWMLALIGGVVMGMGVGKKIAKK